MAEKLDQRVERTYRLLTDALLRLLSEKRLEDITVTELCDLAMIRRATFYKHFANKYELVLFVYRELNRQFDALLPEYDDLCPNAYYAKAVQIALDFLDQNLPFISAVLDSGAIPELLDLITEQIRHSMLTRLRAAQQRGIRLPGPPDLLASQFAGVLIPTCRWRIRHSDPASRDVLLRQSVSLLTRL